jgi:isoaspartyl peptidase/L-asparaginase-like protein (Ntn-hydrolase superfamily)
MKEASLVSDQALSRYSKDCITGGMAKSSADVTDTVGVVCMDHNGNIAAACSSGGPAFKAPGRMGPAAIIGAGLWQDDRVAVVTSGHGLNIVNTCLARDIARQIVDGALEIKLPPETAFIALEKTQASCGDACMAIYGHSSPAFTFGWPGRVYSSMLQDGAVVHGQARLKSGHKRPDRKTPE